MRRSLIYPLHRHWSLSLVVAGDVVQLLRLGPAAVVKGLLEVHRQFQLTEGHYIHNQLYIESYIVWVQSVSQDRLASLAEAVEAAAGELEKEEVGLELVELEEAAGMVVREEEEEQKVEMLTRTVGAIRVESDSDDSDESDSDDDTESESSSEEEK